MTINLFGPPTKNDIKVAYIDPILGLVEGVSIPKANDYAIKEPGTTFIFRDGNQTLQYLNINEVNQLDPNVLITSDECGGISQKKECGPPTIQIFGGGGIGAAGNPIVGNDGAILAVDIIRGGNGYQYPPLVAARDICNYGSGATFTTIIGEVVETTETFDNEADFENYELGDSTDVGYGRRYGPDGEDLGPWDPRVYTNLGQDPIRKEIDEFQVLVSKLGRQPFFSSIKNNPTNIFCSDTKVIPSKYDVRTKWGPESFNPNKFMSSYAISPVSPSNVPGSDFAGRLFTFEWTEDFPTDGEYIFRMLCDNVVYLYVDNLLIKSIKNMWGSTSKGGTIEPVTTVQKTIRKGIHKVRVDLLNLPFYENRITTPQSSSVSSTGLEIAKVGTQSNIEIKKVFNTIDFISKADRTLWRTDPSLHAPQSLINLYGISPFDPFSEAAKTESFAGIHLIVWDNINFPIDGNYRIKMYVDDNVRLFIGEEEIRYNGFTFLGKPSPEFNQIKFFKAGNYKIRAELEQIAGNSSISGGNPMALAIDIDIPTVTETIISPKSWNENAMGVALTIDAPEPTIPQEPIPEQEGRCPNNPIWSTRFPGAKEFWYPVRYSEALRANGITEWSGFFSRYAISPVKPLDIPGSDAGGILFTTSWDIDIPYDGFYQFAVQRDDTARIFVDGNLAFDVKTAGDDIWRDFRNKPKFQKVFISRGRHSIEIELENRKTEAFDQVSQKIFRTKDWQVSAPPQQQQPTPTTEIYNSSVTHIFNNSTDQHIVTATSPDLSVQFMNPNSPDRTPCGTPTNGKYYKITFIEPYIDDSYSISILSFAQQASGGATAGSFKVDGISNKSRFGFSIWFCKSQNGTSSNTYIREFSFQTKGIKENTLTPASPVATTSGGLSGGTSKDGVTYEGPPLVAHKDSGWGTFINNNSVSPIVPINLASERTRSTWRGVRFPESGQYDITFLSNSGGILFIGGREVLRSQQFVENPQIFKVNISQGTYDIVVDSDYPYFSQVSNAPAPPPPQISSSFLVRPFIGPIGDPTGFAIGLDGVNRARSQGFSDVEIIAQAQREGLTFGPLAAQSLSAAPIQNSSAPSYRQRLEHFQNINQTSFVLIIRKNVSVLREGSGKSWVENPIAISAILIPPPCPRRISGRGIVTDVIVNDPGNGYLPPIALTIPPPSALTLIQTDVPGVPGSGAGAGAGGAAGAPGVGPGAPGVGPGAPGVPLSIPSPPSGPPTGINASFRPQFEVVRDPIVINPQKLLQVTDLVGLKQTGYVNGRAYYGAVYYDRGIRYAGFYETVGEPIQVYDTLRESIIAQVITPPSAILRQGTDIRSNNPLLNIPGTVQSTLSSNSIVGAGDISPLSVPFVPEPVSDPIYPVSLRLKSVLVENSGINYNVTDQIRVIPSNGAILEPVFGSFGRVIRVAVIDPGFGFTEYPRIEMFTPL